MDLKRGARSWWVWGAVAVIAFLVISSLYSRGDGYTSVKTSDAVSQITSGNVVSATLHDKEQTLDLTLKNAFNGHKKIKTSYPTDATLTIFNDLQKAKASNSKLTFTTVQSHSNVLLSLILSFLPFILIGLFLFWIMSQAQGGGNRVMSFGRSKAKLVSKDTPEDHVRRRRRSRRGHRGTGRDQGVPGQPGQVPGHRSQDPQGRAAVRAARNR